MYVRLSDVNKKATYFLSTKNHEISLRLFGHTWTRISTHWTKLLFYLLLVVQKSVILPNLIFYSQEIGKCPVILEEGDVMLECLHNFDNYSFSNLEENGKF